MSTGRSAKNAGDGINADSVASSAAAGYFLTVPLYCRQQCLAALQTQAGVEIQLNVKTSVSGFVQVDILDATSFAPVAGNFRSLPIVANDVRAPVLWNATVYCGEH